MNYLRLNNGGSGVIKSISRHQFSSISRLNSSIRYNSNNNSNNNNNNSNNRNEEQKRSYSSFSMKDQEPEKPKSGFKKVLALGLIVAAGSYLYYLRDNQDAVFSTKLPYQKEDIEKFKTMMRGMKGNSADNSDNSSKVQEEEATPKEVEQSTVVLEASPIAVVVLEEEDKVEKEQEQAVDKSLDEEKPIQDKSNDGYGFSNSSSYDEINSEEADLDSPLNSDDSIGRDSDSDSSSVSVSNSSSGSSGNDDDESLGKEFLNIVDQQVKEHAEHQQQEIPVKQEELPKTEYITIIEDKKDSNDHQLKVEESKPASEEAIVSEIIQDVLSLIPIKLTGKEKTEDIIKILEEQYNEMTKSLLSENGKLREELEKINLSKDEYLKSFEEYIKNKYKVALDTTIDLLHGDLGEKLKDMDKYIQENVGENQKLVKETLDRQKENLVNIFNQQSDAIKKSELEKRAITQLTQLIVDIEKLLRDASAQGKLVERSFKNLTDLEQYDELIGQLLKSLPKDFTKNGVVNFEKLQNEFKSLSKEIRRVTLISPKDNSLLGKLVSFIGSELILPEYGLVQGEHPDAYLSRSEEYLRRGELTKAIKEMETLSQNHKELSKYTNKWLDEAKQRDQLENISKILQLKLELIQKQQLEQNQQQQQQQQDKSQTKNN